MEVMIDIETLDTEVTAVTFQVAVVFFMGRNRFKFEWDLDVSEQIRLGRTITADTVAFHLANAIGTVNLAESLLAKDGDSLKSFARDFRETFAEFDPSAVWTKGNFDCPIIKSLIGDVPWKYHQVKELRTLMKECDVPKGKVAHTALQDCLDQIKNLQKCRAIIRKGAKK